MASASAPILTTVPPNQRVLVTNEKVTGPPAAELLRRSGVVGAGSASIEVLDNATGGGILLAELFKLVTAHPGTVDISRAVAGDVDDSMLAAVQLKRDDASGPHSRLWQLVEGVKIDQQAIPLPDNSFTHVFSNFGIFFCQDDQKALGEAHRVLRPGGTVGFTSWRSFAWWSEIAEPAIKQFVPEAPALPAPEQLFPNRGNWTDPEAILAKLEKAGFQNVQGSEYKFTPDVEAEEFAEACGVLAKVVTKRLWTDEQNAKFADQIEPALRRYLLETYKGGKWDGKTIHYWEEGLNSPSFCCRFRLGASCCRYFTRKSKSRVQVSMQVSIPERPHTAASEHRQRTQIRFVV